MVGSTDPEVAETRGVTTVVSSMGFEATLHALLAAIEQRSLRLFDVVDHQAAAVDAGLSLRPTRVVVFGNPTAGTPLMDAYPLLALELPLRILVWDGDDGRARLSYLTADALADQFGVAAPVAGPLAAPAALVAAALAAG